MPELIIASPYVRTELHNSMPESILSPSQGLRIWPQGYIQTYAQGSIQSYSTVRNYTAQCKLM
jgi:hypothetical protein